MAEGALNPSPQPESNSEGAKIPQIQIMPKPEALKVNLAAPASPAPAMPTVKVTPSVNSTPTPAPQKAEAPTPDKAQSNVFTQLFGDDKVMQSADLMKSVNEQDSLGKKSVFGKKPTLKSIKAEQKAKKVSQSGKVLLRASVLLLILVGGFFYTRNHAEFNWLGTNPAQKVMIAQEELNEVQAEVTVQKHLTAALLLDQFSGKADSYLYHLDQSESDVNSSNKQEEFAEQAAEDREEAVVLLEQIVDKVDSTITPEQKVAANTLVSELIKALEAKSGDVDATALTQDIQDLQTARSLIQNDEFRSQLLALDLNNLDAESFNILLGDYNELHQSTYAVIGAIKSQRTEWSAYFTEIEMLTKKVDPLFNTEFPGNIHLTDIHFDANHITISGETSTDDTKNFTLVSNYIDTLEASSSFRNVEDRSFSKNEGEEDYTGQFRITLELEHEE